MPLCQTTLARKPIRTVSVLVFAWLSAITATPFQVASAQDAMTASQATIVSPSRPRDSRGEVVYESQGEKQKDLPVVAGVLVGPKVLKIAKPKFPKSLRKQRQSADVTVEGVVAPSGELIDPKIIGPADGETSKSALEAVAKYRFQPATLDGKPVAVILQVVLNFRTY